MTEENLNQLKNPPRHFAACASRQGCANREKCLRAMAWELNENAALTVLRKDTCSFLPFRTVTICRGIPKLDQALTHSDYRSFRYECLSVVPRVTLWRIQNGTIYASEKYRRHIEQTWARFSDKPFPWVDKREVVDWGRPY